jgi:hypothetical protein
MLTLSYPQKPVNSQSYQRINGRSILSYQRINGRSGTNKWSHYILTPVSTFIRYSSSKSGSKRGQLFASLKLPHPLLAPTIF